MATDLVWSHGPPLRLIRTEDGVKKTEMGVIRKTYGVETFTAYVHNGELSPIGIGQTEAVRGFATEQEAKDFLMMTCSLREAA